MTQQTHTSANGNTTSTKRREIQIPIDEEGFVLLPTTRYSYKPTECKLAAVQGFAITAKLVPSKNSENKKKMITVLVLYTTKETWGVDFAGEAVKIKPGSLLEVVAGYELRELIQLAYNPTALHEVKFKPAKKSEIRNSGGKSVWTYEYAGSHPETVPRPSFFPAPSRPAPEVEVAAATSYDDEPAHDEVA